jgi:Putative DNA-binding domain
MPMRSPPRPGWCQVPLLAELQADMRLALLSGDVAGIATLLVGGTDAPQRFAIHQRHYETSLVTVLLEKFPANTWLLGSDFVMQAARAFVRLCPPSRPCLAEYGDRFPSFLASYEGGAALPYVRSFAELEWHVGQVSIAIAKPALTWSDITRVGVDALPEATLTLQPGLRYLRAAWAVDELMKLYLVDTAPPRFELAAGDFWIEIRGARGELEIRRLDEPTVMLRESLVRGQRLTDAATRAIERDATFDLATAVMELVANGLVTAMTPPTQGAI